MSDALLPTPPEWSQLINVFSSCFTKPQFNNFSQATTAMAVSQYTTINRWAVLAGKHQSSLNDFFTASPWDESAVHEQLSRITVRRIKDTSIGIVDDTMSHKPYAKHMEHAGWYYDGLTKKEQHGHSIVTHGLVSNEQGFVPFDLELYKNDGRSKNDIASSMITRTQRHKKLPLYLVDSWYSNTKVLGKIKEAKSHYITEIKSNRNVTIDKKERFVREHEAHIPKKKWDETILQENKYRYFQTSAFISGLGNTNLVFSQKYDEDSKEWGETYYLITDVLSLSGKRVIELFLRRGGIEGFHREAKQQLGMEHYQLRKCRGIERYLFLVLLVFVLLLLLGKQLTKTSFESKTIGELREHLKAECYTTLFQNAKHLEADERERIAKILARGM